jgi:hypothetical protein
VVVSTLKASTRRRTACFAFSFYFFETESVKNTSDFHSIVFIVAVWSAEKATASTMVDGPPKKRGRPASVKKVRALLSD